MFCSRADVTVSGLDSGETWDAVIGAEPSLAVCLSSSRFDEALLAIAEFVDLTRDGPLFRSRAAVRCLTVDGVYAPRLERVEATDDV